MMTATFRYPSEQFPPFPQVRLNAPDDWAPATVPGAVLAVRAVRPADEFAPNVIVTVGRYSRPFGPGEAVALVGEGLSRHPEAKLDEPIAAALDGERYLIVNVAFDDARAGTLLQAHAFGTYPVPGHEAHVDVVQLIGTCTAAATTADYPLLQQVIESVRVTPNDADLMATAR